MPKPFEPGKQYFFRDQLNCDAALEFIGYAKDGKTVFKNGDSVFIRKNDGTTPLDKTIDDGSYDVMPDILRVEMFANMYPKSMGSQHETRAQCDHVPNVASRVGVIKIVTEDGIPVSVELLKED